MSPIFVLVVLYTIWVGSRAPGGAFPAGALLSGLGVLGLLGLRHVPLGLENARLRLGLALGCGAFLLACLFLWTRGAALLEFPPDSAKWYILAIELACAASIGLSLTLLFAACAGWLDNDSGDPPP
jgi:multisubunit Na+/H+ antiporter MnhB subunit